MKLPRNQSLLVTCAFLISVLGFSWQGAVTPRLCFSAFSPCMAPGLRKHSVVICQWRWDSYYSRNVSLNCTMNLSPDRGENKPLHFHRKLLYELYSNSFSFGNQNPLTKAQNWEILAPHWGQWPENTSVSSWIKMCKLHVFQLDLCSSTTS